MRAELADAIAAVLGVVETNTSPRDLTEEEVDRLVDLSHFVVKARTAVERDGYDRELVVMPEAEAPGRLVGALGAFLSGLEAVGADQLTAWRIVTKAGWDCVPDIRRRLLRAARQQPEARTSDLVTATGIPKVTTLRALEDLALLHLVEGTKASDQDNAAWRWSLSDEAAQSWPR
jgi:hypothetical protein